MKTKIIILWMLIGINNSITSQTIESKIREFARQEYPSDKEMEDYIYNQQVAAYNYMIKVTDSEVKNIAIREYPNDYCMQQYIYNQQLSAKRYMKTVIDIDVKDIAIREYPMDYSMQQYIIICKRI